MSWKENKRRGNKPRFPVHGDTLSICESALLPTASRAMMPQTRTQKAAQAKRRRKQHIVLTKLERAKEALEGNIMKRRNLDDCDVGSVDLDCGARHFRRLCSLVKFRIAGGAPSSLSDIHPNSKTTTTDYVLRKKPSPFPSSSRTRRCYFIKATDTDMNGPLTDWLAGW